MNKKRWMVLLATGVLTLQSGSSAMVLAAETESEVQTEETDPDATGVSIAADGDEDVTIFSEDGTPMTKTVKAYELSSPVQDSYEFPYMGLKFSLPDTLKQQMESSDVIMTSA